MIVYAWSEKLPAVAIVSQSRSSLERLGKFLRRTMLYMSYDVFTYLCRVSDFSSSNFQYCLMGYMEQLRCHLHFAHVLVGCRPLVF